jgi:hypothetical protein
MICSYKLCLLFSCQVLILTCESKQIQQLKNSTSKYLPCRVTLDSDGSQATIENGFIKATLSTKNALEISDIRADFFGDGLFDTGSILVKPIRVFAHWVPGSVPQPLPAVSNITIATASSSIARITAHAHMTGDSVSYQDVDVSATFTISLRSGQVKPALFMMTHVARYTETFPPFHTTPIIHTTHSFPQDFTSSLF